MYVGRKCEMLVFPFVFFPNSSFDRQFSTVARCVLPAVFWGGNWQGTGEPAWTTDTLDTDAYQQLAKIQRLIPFVFPLPSWLPFLEKK